MNQYLKILSFIFVTVISLTGFSQQSPANTLQLSEDQISPKASLVDVSWIQGHWKGEAFGGITEEIWSPPLGDSMMFSFKLVADNKVVFYELGGIRQVDGTLIFQLKHFGNDFKGWEEKDETFDAKLVQIKDNRAYFENINENEIAIYALIKDKGKSEEVKFNYKRQ